MERRYSTSSLSRSSLRPHLHNGPWTVAVVGFVRAGGCARFFRSMIRWSDDALRWHTDNSAEPTPPACCIVASALSNRRSRCSRSTKTTVTKTRKQTWLGGAAAHDPSARTLSLPFLICATIFVSVPRAPPLVFAAAAYPMASSSMCQAFFV